MPSPAGVLFPQVTETPSREFIALQLSAAAGCSKLVVPAAGRFAAATAAVPILGAKNITCCDTGLIPSLLGTLAAGIPLADLGVTVPDLQGLQVFVAGLRDPFDEAAGIMLAVRYLAIRRDTAYMAEQARQVRAAAAGLRAWLAGQLRGQAQTLTGIRYQITPAADAILGADPAAAVFLDLRGMGTRTRKELTAAEQMFWRTAPDPAGPKDIPGLLEVLGMRDQLGIACVTGDKHIPDGWVRLAVTETGGKPDYVIATKDPGGRLAKTRRRPGAPGTWPLYADQEITPDSQVGVISVDRDTALHYRDLIVHRLAGTTTSERFYLFTVDGRVTTVFGLHFRDQVTGKTDYCAETFGITITSDRYARLGKLFMLCLTSSDMAGFLLRSAPNMLQRNPPAGLQTSSPTVGHEGKADRGVMQLVSREPRPGGGFHLVYRTEWRAESWAQVVARWHREQAHHARPGWDGPRLPAPQPEVRKKRRGRGRTREDAHDEQPGG